MYCVTIYNKNLRKFNGDESLRITRLCKTAGTLTSLFTPCMECCGDASCLRIPIDREVRKDNIPISWHFFITYYSAPFTSDMKSLHQSSETDTSFLCTDIQLSKGQLNKECDKRGVLSIYHDIVFRSCVTHNI